MNGSEQVSSGSRCADVFEFMEEERLRTLFREYGFRRMRVRAEKLLGEMIREGTDRTFLRRLFEAAGGSRNKACFAELYDHTVRKYPEDLFRSSFEAVLWGESGLLPADGAGIRDPEAYEKARDLWAGWGTLRPDAEPKIPWTRSAVRPLASPERRIGWLCAFLKTFGTHPLEGFLARAESMIPDRDTLTGWTEIFLLRDPFWEQRTTFASRPLPRPARLMGRKRALALLTDVLFPSLAARCMLEGKHEQAEKILHWAAFLPAPETNAVVRKTGERFFRDGKRFAEQIRDAAAFQGVMDLGNSYCIPAGGNCAVCPFHPEENR